MWNVPDQFLKALGKTQKRDTLVTFQNPGGAVESIDWKTGSVTLNVSSRIRRTGDLTVYAQASDFDRIMLPGTVFRITHGLVLGSLPLVPVFCGEINRGSMSLGGPAGTLRLPLVDLGTWLARSDFSAPFAPGNISRAAAIQAIVADARPDTLFDTAGAHDTGTIGVGKLWTGSRLDAISTLCADGGLEAFFGPDGTYVIRDQPTLSTTPAWTIRGLVKAGERQRPLDKLYNRVEVNPAATDGTQTWTQQVAEITDTSSPRHYSKIGRVTYRMNAPTALTGMAALRAAQIRLARLQGRDDSLNLDMIGNPALEGGDVLRIVIPETGQKPADLFTHMVEGFTMNLATGGMMLDTKSQELVA